jgi:hypothetical protein
MALGHFFDGKLLAHGIDGVDLAIIAARYINPHGVIPLLNLQPRVEMANEFTDPLPKSLLCAASCDEPLSGMVKVPAFELPPPLMIGVSIDASPVAELGV